MTRIQEKKLKELIYLGLILSLRKAQTFPLSFFEKMSLSSSAQKKYIKNLYH